MDNKYTSEEYLYSEITSKLIRFAYDIYDELGYGLPERVYHKAFEKLLEENDIKYQREKYGVVKFNGTNIGKYFLDFLIDGKVALEFKVRNEIYETDVNQLLNYIKLEKIRIGLLIVFTKNGLKLKRLIN